jgi:predicted HicB family RNase H-like nuclease
MSRRLETNKYKHRQISLRMSLAQRAELQQKADLAGLSLNAYVLAATQHSQVVGVNNEQIRELKQLNGWLNRINSNLNMIARVCNFKKEKVDLVLVNICLSKIKAHVENVAKEYQQ